MFAKKSAFSVLSALLMVLLLTSTAWASPLKVAVGQHGVSLSQTSIKGKLLNAPETYFQENFESYAADSYPSSFTQIYNGCGDAEQKVITTLGHDGTDSKVFRLCGQNNWASEHYVPLPSPIPAFLVVDAYVKPVSGNWPGGLRLRHPSGDWGTEISSVVFNTDGNITSGVSVIGSYTMGTWYRVTMEHNIAQKKYAVYVNGVKLAEDLDMHPTLSPTQLELLGGNSGTNEIYFDNVSLIGDLTTLFPCTPPPSGMISWWGGDNSALDMVGTNNGTLMGNATYASGMVGQAFSFDGAETSFVEIPDSAELNPNGAFSVDGWFYIDPEAVGNDGEIATLVAKSQGSLNNGWSLYFDDRQNTKSLKFVLSSIVEAYFAIPTANWYHITGVYNPLATPQSTLYLNGVVIVDSGSRTETVSDNSLNIRIGAMHWTDVWHEGNDRLNGKADEVEFFNRALSADEIIAIYNAGSAGKCRSCMPAPANTVSWWDAESNANDIVGTNHGTLTNGATFGPGKVGQAFSFDGVNDYVQVPDAPNLSFAPASPLTIYMWAYPTTVTPAMHLIGKRTTCWDAGDSSNYQIAHDSTSGVSFNSGGTQLLSGKKLLPNRWQHIALTADGTTFRIYIDGQEKASMLGTLGGQNTAPLDIGGVCSSDEGVKFPGLLDEVTIVNRALTATEIAALYNAGSAGCCKSDNIPPIVVSVIRADPNPTKASNVDFTVTFSENVTGVDTTDFVLTKTGSIAGESVSTVAGGPNVYSVTVTTGSGDGTLSLDVKGSGTDIQDLVGNPIGGGYTSGDAYDIDKTAPTVTLSSAASDPTKASPIAVTVQFSETVTEFVADDILPGNGMVSNFLAVDGDTYTFDLTPSTQGPVTADIAAGVAIDSAGNANTAAAQFSRVYDTVAPSMTMSSTVSNPTDVSPISVTVEFSETVTGFTSDDIVTSNGTVSNFVVVDGDTHTFDLTPSAQGPVTADIAAEVATDLAGNANTAAAQFSRTYAPIYKLFLPLIQR